MRVFFVVVISSNNVSQYEFFFVEFLSVEELLLLLLDVYSEYRLYMVAQSRTWSRRQAGRIGVLLLLLKVVGILLLVYLTHPPAVVSPTLTPRPLLVEAVAELEGETDVSSTALVRVGKSEFGASKVILSCLFVTPQFYRSSRKMPSLDWVVVFLNSAFFHIRGANVVLFVDEGTKASLLALSDVKRLVSTEFLNLTVVPDRYLSYEFSVNISNAANNFRFLLFKHWMEQRKAQGQSPAFVMISDVTDVYFQSDPFASLEAFGNPDTVAFTLEDALKHLGNEKYNIRWLSCYGADTLRAVKGKPISCAGATLGRFHGMLRYTSLQVEELSRPNLIECSRKKIMAALDQATHNYNLHIRGPMDLPGLMQTTEIVFHGNFGKPVWDAARKNVLNRKGEPYPVVHQYTSNRHPAIMEVARKLWGPQELRK